MARRTSDHVALRAQAVAGFRTTYGGEPTAVGSAPGRVNLIGEHTDYNGGLCLPIALPHRTYAAVRPRTDGRVQLASRQAPPGQDHWRGALDSVRPGQVCGWPAYVVGVLWLLREAGIDVPGVDVYITSEVPLGAGLSSSAALECAVATALVDPAHVDPSTLIDVCRRAEAEFAGAPTGGLDQTIALLASEGEALLIDFNAQRISAVRMPAGLVVLVIDTRVSHALNDGGYALRRSECEAAAHELGLATLRAADESRLDVLKDPVLRRRARHVITEITRVEHAVGALQTSDWPRLGELFVASHESLRDDFEVSCPELDAVVQVAVAHGAYGARMTGGGFGGSAIALVQPEQVEPIVAAVEDEFERNRWHAPDWLTAEPSAGARHERLD